MFRSKALFKEILNLLLRGEKRLKSLEHRRPAQCLNRCLPDFKARKLCSVVLKILKVVRFKVLRFKTNEVAQYFKDVSTLKDNTYRAKERCKTGEAPMMSANSVFIFQPFVSRLRIVVLFTRKLFSSLWRVKCPFPFHFIMSSYRSIPVGMERLNNFENLKTRGQAEREVCSQTRRLARRLFADVISAHNRILTYARAQPRSGVERLSGSSCHNSKLS